MAAELATSMLEYKQSTVSTEAIPVQVYQPIRLEQTWVCRMSANYRPETIGRPNQIATKLHPAQEIELAVLRGADLQE